MYYTQGGDKGWFIPLRQHSVSGDSEAVGAIVMALTNPGYGKPSLLNMAEVELVAKQAGQQVQADQLTVVHDSALRYTPKQMDCVLLKI